MLKVLKKNVGAVSGYPAAHDRNSVFSHTCLHIDTAIDIVAHIHDLTADTENKAKNNNLDAIARLIEVVVCYERKGAI